MKTRIYDLVRTLLTDNPGLRDSDKKLIWNVYRELGLVENGDKIFIERTYIYYGNFLKAPSTETIRRCRQKIQELHPELQSSKWIREQREKIADQKGTYIYREEVQENLI